MNSPQSRSVKNLPIMHHSPIQKDIRVERDHSDDPEESKKRKK